MVRKEICWLVPFVCIQVDGPNVPPIILAAASKIFFRLLIHVNFFRSYYNSAHVRFGTVPLRRNVGAIDGQIKLDRSCVSYSRAGIKVLNG